MIETATAKDIELLAAPPQEMNLSLYAPTEYAFRINDDPDWLRARLLLGALFRKYGRFALEISPKVK